MAAALRMHRARHQFLAGAALAEDEHGGVGRRHFLDAPAHLEHGVVGGDETLERRGRLRLEQHAVLPLERVHVERAAHQQAQHFDVDRLLVEIPGAERHGAHRVVAIVVAGDDDDLGGGIDAEDFRQRGHAFADAFRIGRQPQILQHHARLMTAQQRQRFGARGGHEHFVFVKAPLELLLQPLVVFDDQQL